MIGPFQYDKTMAIIHHITCDCNPISKQVDPPGIVGDSELHDSPIGNLKGIS